MPVANNPDPDRRSGYAAIFAGISLLILFFMVVPIGRVHPDDFYLGRLYLDLFVDGGEWHKWVPPSAPSFFPDGVIYGIISMFTMDIVKVSVLYAGVIVLLTGVLLFALGRVLGLEKSPALLTVMVVVLGFFFFGEQLTVWSRPSQHFLSYFNFALCSTLLLLAIRRSGFWVALAPLIAISVMSDFLFIPLFMASSLAVILVCWLQNDIPLSKGLRSGALVLAAVLTGVIVYKIVIPNPQPNPVWASGVSIRSAFTSFAPHVQALRNTIDGIISIPFLVMLIAVGSAYLANRRDRRASAAITIVSVMFVSAIAANLYTVGLGSEFTMSRPQYSILVLNGELTLFAFAVGFLMHGRLSFVPHGFVLTGLAAMAVAITLESPSERRAFYAQLLDEVNCVADIVRSHDLTYGLASFKESDRFTVISKNQVSLNTLVGNRLTTKHYVLSRAWSERLFDYVLVQNSVDPAIYADKNAYYPLSQATVERSLGEPSGLHACSMFSVMIYDRKIKCRPNDAGTHDCDSFL